MKLKKIRKTPPCHSGPIEVIKNLFCGSEKESLDMASAAIGAEVLIPLDRLEAKIWELGFRGEVLYYPIMDYGILPEDVLADLVAKILDRIGCNKKVGLFCVGGHGRTGYVAAAVLGRLGYDDPIGFLRKNYCSHAVESNEQIYHIAEFLDKPDLADRYGGLGEYSLTGDFTNIYYRWYDFEHGIEASPAGYKCGDCEHYLNGICESYNTKVEADECACIDFESY